MTQAFSKFVLKTFGWTLVGGKVEEDKCVILEAPHTSIWDFVIGYLYYRAVGGHLKVMIKKEAFFFPVGPILRSMGGFPIDRSRPQETIIRMVREMNSGDGKDFHMVMCPEGTRKAVRKWKTGYHTIARSAGLPVYISYVDWKHKRTGIECKVELTDDARADTDRIQKIYEDLDLGALHPEGYRTH